MTHIRPLANPLQAALGCAILGGGCWTVAITLAGRLVGAW